jgi:CRP-like cAMP-binding protein
MAQPTKALTEFLSNLYPIDQLPSDMLMQFIDELMLRKVSKGETLYDIGDPANRFYLVMDGHVELLRMNQNNQFATFALVDSGEFFGFEAVHTQNQYEIRAIAQTESTLLALDPETLLSFAREHDQLARFLNTMSRSYYQLIDMRLSWRREEEYVYWTSRRHPLYLWLKLFVPLGITIAAIATLVVTSVLYGLLDNALIFVLLLVVIVVAGLPSIYIYINWRDDFYIITDRRVIARHREILLYETKKEVPFEALLSVNKNIHNIIGATLLIGDVDIRTFTGVIPIHGIADPDVISSFIDDIKHRRESTKGKQDRQEKMRDMRIRLGLEQEKQENGSQSNESQEELDLSEDSLFYKIDTFFQRLFKLRIEQGDEVTFRKHWYILLKHAKIPLLIGSLLLITALIPLSTNLYYLAPIFFGVLAFLFLANFLVFLYIFIDWQNDRYVLNNRQIMDLDKKPLGKENRRTAPLNTIQSVEYKREGIAGIILNFGTVYIRVGDTRFTFDDVPRPYDVQQEVTERQQSAKEREAREKSKNEREVILDWIEIYHQVAHKNGANDTATGIQKPQVDNPLNTDYN